MAGSRIVVTRDQISKRLAAMHPMVEGMIWTVLNYEAPRIQGHMQAHAPWQDQTGNARQGLKARAMRGNGEYSIELFHTMPYGIFLETRWSGRYAIIRPTLVSQGPRVMMTMRGALGRLA